MMRRSGGHSFTQLASAFLTAPYRRPIWLLNFVAQKSQHAATHDYMCRDSAPVGYRKCTTPL